MAQGGDHPVARALYGIMERRAIEQGGGEGGVEGVARAFDVAVDARVVALRDAVCGDDEVGYFAVFGAGAAGDDDGFQARAEQAARGGDGRVIVVGRALAQVAEFVVVRRDEVGAGDEAVAVAGGEFGAHVEAAVVGRQYRVDADVQLRAARFSPSSQSARMSACSALPR